MNNIANENGISESNINKVRRAFEALMQSSTTLITTKELVDKTQLQRREVQNATRELVDSGVVKTVRNGIYQLNKEDSLLSITVMPNGGIRIEDDMGCMELSGQNLKTLVRFALMEAI